MIFIGKAVQKVAEESEKGIERAQSEIAAAEAMLARANRRHEFHNKHLAIVAEMATLADAQDKLANEYADVI